MANRLSAAKLLRGWQLGPVSLGRRQCPDFPKRMSRRPRLGLCLEGRLRRLLKLEPSLASEPELVPLFTCLLDAA